MVYTTKGTCSVEINFDVIDGRLHAGKFTGGCNGNLKGIGALVEGMKPEDGLLVAVRMKSGSAKIDELVFRFKRRR